MVRNDQHAVSSTGDVIMSVVLLDNDLQENGGTLNVIKQGQIALVCTLYMKETGVFEARNKE